METYQNDESGQTKESKDIRQHGLESRSGRMFAGLVVVSVGALLLARQAGIDLPEWLFSWGMLLVAFGVFIGAKHSFRGFGWMIPIMIGSAVTLEHAAPELAFHQYIWPMLIIVFGLFLIFRPRSHRRRHRWDRWHEMKTSSDDAIDATSIFGGTKKIIISKDFRGGDITTLFGATDLDLMQADFNGTVTLDITQAFGGTKLIVPANWSIKSDVVCVFGSIEDKRHAVIKEGPDPTKVLKLDGTCVFGGIEIKNY